uniref:hypothetical protein n=1 Tax=Ruminococcus flavefaciens TaxID=1265 RepID=UPI0026F01728
LSSLSGFLLPNNFDKNDILHLVFHKIQPHKCLAVWEGTGLLQYQRVAYFFPWVWHRGHLCSLFLLSIISYLGEFFNKKQLLSVTGRELLSVIAKYETTHFNMVVALRLELAKTCFLGRDVCQDPIMRA